MKTTLYAAIQILLLDLNGFTQGTCSSADAAQPLAMQQPLNPAQPNPSAQEVLEFLSQRPSSPAQGAVSAHVPAARIRVVDPASVNRAASNSNGLSDTTAIPTARIRVVEDPVVSKANIEAPKDTESAAANADVEAAVIAATTPVESAALDPALARLVGTWKAVARHGDGELATVELQLDDRGWARFTVPSADGKSTTIRRRAELNGEELKLTGTDASLLLGNLIEVSDRQMVLARAEGKLTFVRPR